MHEKLVILFCAAAAVLSHEIEITTPTPDHSSVPVIASNSYPSAVSRTYLPTPEVKIGQYKPSAYSAYSSYVPSVQYSAYQPASAYDHSLNYVSTTQATPLYTKIAPVYSTPASFQVKSSFGKSYPTVASYSKSTIAPSYSYKVTSTPKPYVASYPSYSQTYSNPVFKTSYSQPLSHYSAAVPTVAPLGYSSYSDNSYVSYPSSTPFPSLVSSTLGYDTNSALAYSVSPTVAAYSSTPSYSIQPAPLKAQFSYAAPSYSFGSHHVGYGGEHLVDSGHYISEPAYSTYSGYHGGSLGYAGVPIGSHLAYGHGLNYGWKK